MPECQCENAGWCDLFKKEMTYDPPNWQWCKSLSEDQRREYFNKMESTVRVLKKAPDEKKADIVNFFDILPEKKSKYAVCVIPANDSAMELLDITRAGVKKYAEKCGADYIELSGDQNPDWTMSNKYRLNRVAKSYDKTLYLDCDIVVKDDAPNIFELTPDDKISAYDEYEIFKQRNDTAWIRNQQEHIFITTLSSFSDDIKEEYITNGEFITESMINGGVLVIPNALADYYKQPSSPYTKFWCFDQHLLTLELPEEKFNNLTYKFNCEYEGKDFWYFTHDAHFIHLNGLNNKPDFRKYVLNQFSLGDFALHKEEQYNNTKFHFENLKKINIVNKNLDYDTDFFAKNKIGIFFNNLVPGGALTWLNDFVSFYKDDITGIVAVEDFPEYDDITCGLKRGFTTDHMYELYEKSDIIIYWIYWIHSMPIPDFWLLNAKNKKIIFISHGSLRVSVLDDLLKFFKPDKFVCVDEYVIKKHNGIYIPPIIKEKGIIRNPIRKNVLWHHRLETNKGLSILVDIIEAMPDYTFHIAGNWMPSICTKEIIKSVETRILSPEIENVFFYGLLEDMSDLFSMCSLSLSTSFDESFGISIAESIANGIPSVSNCAGVGKYSDKIIPYEAHYSEWVKEIRICDQSIKEAKNKSFINNNYSSDNFKQSWDNVLWS